MRHPLLCVALGWAVLLASAGPTQAENWPLWRGPRGDGTSRQTGVPTHWSHSDNIAWKTAIPGEGHASPIVWADRVFVVTAREETLDRVLLCLDRRSGEILWQRVVLNAPLERKHPLNSYASSTPATDGASVFVAFLDGTKMLVAAYDFQGQRKWLVRPGEFHSMHGFCSSPVLFENLVILNGDHDGKGYLVALDRASGETVWKTPRPNHTRSYCPPILRQLDGRWQMILGGSLCVASYDPRNGSQHWLMDGPTEQFVASLVDNGKLVFLTAGYPELHILAIRPDGRGKIGDEKIVWRTKKGCAYVPSPIVSDDGKYFLVVSDKGVASCFDTADGTPHWTKRIGTHYSASLVSAEGLVHFLSDEGVTTIVRPAVTFQQVAENDLGEACCASPAIGQGQIFFRARKHLYCVGRGE